MLSHKNRQQRPKKRQLPVSSIKKIIKIKPGITKVFFSNLLIKQKQIIPILKIPNKIIDNSNNIIMGNNTKPKIYTGSKKKELPITLQKKTNIK